MVIEIQDDGAGISSENQSLLFKEIVQFNPENLQAGGGTGLGLWISKNIVDMHNGHISVHSEGEGKGSTFRLEIPMSRKKNNSINPSIISETNSSKSSMGTITMEAHSETPSMQSLSTVESDTPIISVPVLPLSSTNIQVPQNPVTNESMATLAVTATESETSEPLSIVNESVVPYIDSVAVISANQHMKSSSAPARNKYDSSPPISYSTSYLNIQLMVESDEDDMEEIRIRVERDENSLLFVNVNISESSCMDTSASKSQSCSSSRLIHTDTEPNNRNTTAVVPIKKQKFLIVDDVTMIRKMLRKLLEQRGHTCDEAEDGLAALNMVKDETNIHIQRYDAIFMDFVMPNMSGPDATRAIRELGYTGPIIGVTGNALNEDKETFMNAGLTDIIVKPLRMEALVKILDV